MKVSCASTPRIFRSVTRPSWTRPNRNSRDDDDATSISPLPLREREGPVQREGEGARAGIEIVAARRVTPHLPIDLQWAPSSPARGEGLSGLGDMTAPAPFAG